MIKQIRNMIIDLIIGIVAFLSFIIFIKSSEKVLLKLSMRNLDEEHKKAVISRMYIDRPGEQPGEESVKHVAISFLIAVVSLYLIIPLEYFGTYLGIVLLGSLLVSGLSILRSRIIIRRNDKEKIVEINNIIEDS